MKRLCQPLTKKINFMDIKQEALLFFKGLGKNPTAVNDNLVTSYKEIVHGCDEIISLFDFYKAERVFGVLKHDSMKVRLFINSLTSEPLTDVSITTWQRKRLRQGLAARLKGYGYKFYVCHNEDDALEFLVIKNDTAKT